MNNTYGEIVKVAFSPNDMGDSPAEPRIPSSQPVGGISQAHGRVVLLGG